MHTDGSYAALTKGCYQAGSTIVPVALLEPQAAVQTTSRTSVSRWRLAAPLLLLAVEVGTLTPFVEFTDGQPLAYVANARVCAGLLFALVAFLFGAGWQLGELGFSGAGSRRRLVLGLAGNLCLYGAFFWLTLRLANAGGPSAWPWVVAGLWVLLALAIGLTSFLAFLPLRFSGLILAQLWIAGAVALSLGLAFALLTPWAQSFWPRWHGPAVALDQALLQWTHGEGLRGVSREGFPVLGIRGFLVQVNPQCSELEAILALWLLGGAVIFARWGDVHKAGMLLVILAGTAIVYLLLAVRIYGLVVAGIVFSPQTCVGLAHSRIGTLLFLGVAATILTAGCRWCRFRACPGGA
jgi:exosortase/archaeosortase family protein